MKILSFLIVLVVSINLSAQNTFLKITKNDSKDKDKKVIMYPPGTAFELKNKHGYIVFKNSETPAILDVNEAHTLYVFPKWKNEVDVFRITKGRVEKVLTEDYGKTNDHLENENREDSGKIKANFTVTDSEEFEGEKNIHFRLSNGLTFIYEDKKYRAYLNDLENYIRIEGKYIIKSELGILRISFNEKTGRTWWVFEPKQ